MTEVVTNQDAILTVAKGVAVELMIYDVVLGGLATDACQYVFILGGAKVEV